MIHFLRNKQGDTLLELMVFTDDGTTDVRSDVNITNYTDFLLGLDDDKEQEKTKIVFDKLSEARGWYWEVYRKRINENPTKQDVEAMIGLMVQSAAGVTKLEYITG